LKAKYVPIERNRLRNLIKEAKAAGDEERMDQLKAELQALEGPKLAFNTTRTPPKKQAGPSQLTQQEQLAILNKENRRKNAEQVRIAQLKERRATKAMQAAIARGEVVEEDHSKRVRTVAKFKHNFNEFGKKPSSDRSGTNTPVATPELIATKGTLPVPLIAKLQQKPGPTGFRRPLTDDDIIGSIDLGIDIEI
jgi:RNA polymerase-associated protein RTF1